MKRKLTETVCRRATCPDGKRVDFIWDTSGDGLGLRIMASGIKTFVVRIPGAKAQRVAVGRFPEIGPEEARSRARAARRAAKDASGAAVPAWGLTIAQAWQRYSAARGHLWAQATAKRQASLFRRYIGPAIGDRPLARITVGDLERLHTAVLPVGPAAAREVIKVLRSLFSWSESSGLSQGNPAKAVRVAQTRTRQEVLSADDLAAFFRIAAEFQTERPEWTAQIQCLQAIALTGLRRDEMRTLRRADCRLLRRSTDEVPSVVVACKATRSNPEGRRTVYLSAEAATAIQAAIDRVPPRPSAFTFWRTTDPSEPITRDSLRVVFSEIRARLGRPGLVIHTLRTSFLTLALQSGVSLPVVARLAGHANPTTTTKHYLRLAQIDEQRAAQQVGDAFADLMAYSLKEIK